MLSHIFDLFVQADRALDRAAGGLGIGLTLVRSLVEMHGGTVTAASDGLGRGSEFSVRLPVLPATRVSSATDREGGVARHIPPSLWRRILIVDAVRRHKPEIVLLDIGLPIMDGYEVARRLRQEHGREHLILVAMTGYGQDEDRRRSEEAGFNAHLVKPVDLDMPQTILSRGEVAASRATETKGSGPHEPFREPGQEVASFPREAAGHGRSTDISAEQPGD